MATRYQETAANSGRASQVTRSRVLTDRSPFLWSPIKSMWLNTIGDEKVHVQNNVGQEYNSLQY